MMQIVEIPNPFLDAAKERARQLEATFQFNGVMAMLDALAAEVDCMRVADRFSHSRKIFSRYPPIHPFLPRFLEMSEEEFQRWHLTQHFRHLQQTILGLANEFRIAVMEMEATKVD